VSGKYFQTLRRIAEHLNYQSDTDAQRVPKKGLKFFFFFCKTVLKGTEVTADRGIAEAP
jgi:hypothetical protein